MPIPDAQGRTPPKKRPPKPKPLSTPQPGTALQNQVPAVLTGPRTKAKTGATTVDWGTGSNPAISPVHAVVSASPRVQKRQANIKRGAAPGGGPGSRERTQAIRVAKSGSTAQIQQTLNQHGFHVAVDGVWGPQTAAAWASYTGTLAHSAVKNAQAQDQYLREAVVRPQPQHAEEMATLGPEKYAWLQQARKDYAKEIQREQQRMAVQAQIPKLEAATPAQVAHAQKYGWAPSEADVWANALKPLTDQLREIQASQLGGTTTSNLLWGEHLYSPLTLFTGHTLTGESGSAVMGGVNAAMVAFPMLRPLRAVKAGAFAVRALVRGGEAAATQVGEHAAEGIAQRELSPLTARLVRMAERNQRLGQPLTQEMKDALTQYEAKIAEAAQGPVRAAAREAYNTPTASRVFKAGAMRVIAPAARSRTGRVVEHMVDSLRPALSRATRGFYKSPEAKAFEELGRHARYQSRIDEAQARALQKVARKLDDAKEYALRVVAEGVMPEARAQHHLDLAAAEEAAGNDPTALYHAMHADMNRQAAKYIDTSGEVPVLRKDAPIALHKALDLLVKVSGSREDLYQQLGRLSDEAIAGRLIAPARVLNGAVWREHEAMLREALDASPMRAEAKRALEQITSDPVEVNAAMTMWDAMVRSAALQSQGDQRAFNNVLRHLTGIEYGMTTDSMPPGFESLYQQVPLPVQGLPEKIDVAGIRAAVRGMPMPQKMKTARGFNGIVSDIYDMAKAGARFRDWYARAAENIRTAASYEGVSPKTMAQLIAVYSQQAMPTANMGFAVKALREYKALGEIISLGPGGKVQRDKALAILKGGEWSGRKTNSFYANIMKYLDPQEHAALGGHEVTVDRHVVSMFEGIDKTRLGESRYNTYERIFQAMAEQLGWHPEEVQAAAWATMKATKMELRYGSAASKHLATAGDAFERGLQMHVIGDLEKKLTAMEDEIVRSYDLRGLQAGQNLKRLNKGVDRRRTIQQQLRSKAQLELYNSNPEYRALADRWDSLRQQSPDPETLFQEYTGPPLEIKQQYPDDYSTKLTAFRDGKPVGNIRLSRFGPNEPWQIDGIVVLEQHRRQGIATELFRQAENRLGNVVHETNPGLLSAEGRAFARSTPPESLDKLAADAQQPDGGFTIDSLMRPHEGGGFAAATFPERELVLPASEVTPEVIQKYIVDNTDVLGSYPNMRVGGWHDPADGKFYLDLSEVFATKADAMVAALAKEQKAIFDFSTFESVPVEDPQAVRDQLWAEMFHGKEAAMGKPAVSAAERGIVPGSKLPLGGQFLGQEGNLDAERAAWEAFGADIRRSLPRDEWPKWVKNQELGPAKPIDVTPLEPIRPTVRRLPGESTADHQARVAAAEQDYMIRRQEWMQKYGDKTPGGDTFPTDWLAQKQSLNYYHALVNNAPDLVKAIGHDARPLPLMQGLHRAWSVAMANKDPEMARKIAEATSQLYLQRGGALDAVSPYGVKAAIRFNGQGDNLTAVMHFSEYSDISSWIHETAGHFFPMFLNERDARLAARWAGGNIDPRNGPIDRDAAEKFARAMEKYWWNGHAPQGLGNVARTISPRMRDLYEGSELPDYPANIEAVFQRMFNAPRLKGGMLVGAEDIGPVGLARVPTVRGRPLPSGVTGMHRKVAAYTRYILSGGRIIGKGADDQALRKAYEGAALRSGYFTFDVVKPTTQDLILASRISLVHRMREELIKAGNPLPVHVTDVAVKINPDKATPKEIELLLERMRQIDSEGGKLTQKDLSRIDPGLLDAAQRDIFPARLTEADGTERDVRVLAAEIMNTQEPIDNIVWVPHEWLKASGLIPRGTPGGTIGAVAAKQAGLMTIDMINDLQKAMILYLNPSYIPVNLAGNLVMNAMHQGVFTPINLWKGALAHQYLDVEHRVLMDNVMGNGLTAALQLKTGPGQLVHSTLGHWINLAVDLVPRRAAFLHEARRRGYKSRTAVRDLLDAALKHDEEARFQVEQIARQANDAIVDYERMSPMEREITSRLIFFYPWLKGATRYTLRFPLEHPAEAAALMLLGEHAKMIQDQRLGTTPFYADTAIPAETGALGLKVPYGPDIVTLGDIVGDHKWNVDRNGQTMPEVINARQLLTFTTPLDLYAAGYAFFTGDKNAPAVIENLTPAVYSGIVALSGYDPFRHKEVPQSIGTFIRQLEDVPQAQRYHQITLTPSERRQYQAKSLYPRSKNEEISRLFFSGLAPTPYNRAVAAERLLADSPLKVRHVEQAKQDQKKYKLAPLTPQVLSELDQYDSMEHEIKAGMTGVEKLKIAAKYYAASHPGWDSSWVNSMRTEGEAEHYYTQIRSALFPDWQRWNYYRDKAKSAAEATKPVTP